MTLEEYIAHLNGLVFWKEFTFAQNKFIPQPGAELELADNPVWLDTFAIAMQLKERGGETENPETERTWFQKKVLGEATSQVRDTLRYLEEHDRIRITNERGHSFDIRGAGLADVTKIVVFFRRTSTTGRLPANPVSQEPHSRLHSCPSRARLPWHLREAARTGGHPALLGISREGNPAT